MALTGYDHKYDDILHLSRPENPRRCRMSRKDRAAQFSPFAALTGFDETIEEAGRLTDRPIQLEESRQEELNRQLQDLYDAIHTHPRVTLTHFVYDERKAGGTYVRTTGNIKKIDPIQGYLRLTSGKGIFLEDIIAIETA